MYKTNNFYDYSSWSRRIIFVSLFTAVSFLTYLDVNYMTPSILIVVIAVYILLIIIGQFDELEITTENVIVSQKSIVPFLRSKRVIPINSIESIKRNSNFIQSEGHWFVFLHKKDDNLELNLCDGKYEIISGKLHPNGSKAIAEIIEEIKKNN